MDTIKQGIENELLIKIIENLIECPVCRHKSLLADIHSVTCKNCGTFTTFSIDTDTLKIVSFELVGHKHNKMPRICIGDIVRIASVHCSELNCYEVTRIESDGVVSQPAAFHHRYDEIIAIYRFDGTDFKCIWVREGYRDRLAASVQWK